jgi:hypothetical protein
MTLDRKRKLDWLWMQWDLGLMDDWWPPEEVECD